MCGYMNLERSPKRICVCSNSSSYQHVDGI